MLKKLQTKNHKLQTSQGLGMVELIVVIGIILTTVTSLLQLVTLERRTQIFAQESAAAYILARETLEATRSTRDEDWANISVLPYATRYYPELTGGKWQLSATNPGPVGKFTRWVEFNEVLRDAATDDIASAGSPDPDSRQITAYVEWTRIGGSTKTIQLDTYLTNWQAY